MNVLDGLRRFDWGNLAQDIGLALLIFIGAFMASSLVRQLFQRARQQTVRANASLYVAEKLVTYGLIIFGGMLALSVTGLDLTSLAVFAGAIGVGVGLGLQGIVKEFVSGLVIIFDPNIRVGDFIQINEGLRGEITEVGPRATRLRTNDGLNVAIPNSTIIENQVINWTFRGGTRRIHVPFRVAYGSDKAKVREAVLRAAHDVSFTMPDTDSRRTQVWLTGFGENALEFELVVWPTPDAVRRPAALMAAYNWAIEDALRAECVEVPFPQSDLHVRSFFGLTGEDALGALGMKTRELPKPEVVTPSQNDAERDLRTDLPPEPEDDPPPKP